MTESQKIRKKIRNSFEKYVKKAKAKLDGQPIFLRISKEQAMPLDPEGHRCFANAITTKRGAMVRVNLDFCLLLPNAVDYVVAHEISHHITGREGHSIAWEEAVATLGHDPVGEGKKIIAEWKERRSK